MIKIMLILLALSQIGCAGFGKRFVEAPGSVWNPGENNHAFYSNSTQGDDMSRYEKTRDAYSQSEITAKEKGWDTDKEHSSDYWFYLNLHQ